MDRGCNISLCAKRQAQDVADRVTELPTILCPDDHAWSASSHVVVVYLLLNHIIFEAGEV